MSDLEKWNLIVGFGMPLVVAALNRRDWSDEGKAAVAFVVCAVAGMVTAYFTGNLGGAAIPSSILEVLVVAIGFYKLFWQKVGFLGRA